MPDTTGYLLHSKDSIVYSGSNLRHTPEIFMKARKEKALVKA